VKEEKYLFLLQKVFKYVADLISDKISKYHSIHRQILRNTRWVI